VNKKREAREFCFQYFFHLQLPVFEELKNGINDKELSSSINEFKESTNSIFNDELNNYVFTQIKTTLANYSKIEDVVQKYLKNWKLNRISRVDHTNLLLAVNEICYDKSTPVSIVINEAIEISKKFGSIDSGPFVNGILDNIAKNEL
jgi:N utilization substance protein B